MPGNTAGAGASEVSGGISFASNVSFWGQRTLDVLKGQSRPGRGILLG